MFFVSDSRPRTRLWQRIAEPDRQNRKKGPTFATRMTLFEAGSPQSRRKGVCPFGLLYTVLYSTRRGSWFPLYPLLHHTGSGISRSSSFVKSKHTRHARKNSAASQHQASGSNRLYSAASIITAPPAALQTHLCSTVVFLFHPNRRWELIDVTTKLCNHTAKTSYRGQAVPARRCGRGDHRVRDHQVVCSARRRRAGV